MPYIELSRKRAKLSLSMCTVGKKNIALCVKSLQTNYIDKSNIVDLIILALIFDG